MELCGNDWKDPDYPFSFSIHDSHGAISDAACIARLDIIAAAVAEPVLEIRQLFKRAESPAEIALDHARTARILPNDLKIAESVRDEREQVDVIG